MPYIIETNNLFYILDLSGGLKYDNFIEDASKASLDWKLSDVAFVEAMTHFRSNKCAAKKVLQFYKDHKNKIANAIKGFEIQKYISENSSTLSKITDELYEFKIGLEIELIFDFLFVVLDVNTQRKIIEYGIVDKRAQVESNVSDIRAANSIFIKALIDRILRPFYEGSSERPEMTTEIRKLIFMILFVAEWNICAAKHNMKIGELRDKLESKEIEEPNIVSAKELKRTIDNINEKSSEYLKIKKSKLEVAILNYESNHIFDALKSRNTYAYYHEMIRRIFTSGKKIDKNDLLDALYIDFVPDQIVLTKDGTLRSVIACLSPDSIAKADEAMGKLSQTVLNGSA